MSMAVTEHWLREGPSNLYPAREASFKDAQFVGVQNAKLTDRAPGPCVKVYFH